MKQPAFDLDYAYGQQGELLVANVLQQVAAGQAQIEVKTERYRNDWLYVETYQNPHRCGVWRPSGINVTTAEVWAFVKADTGVMLWFPVWSLREAIARGLGKDCEEKDGDNPTRGRLIRAWSLFALAVSP